MIPTAAGAMNGPPDVPVPSMPIPLSFAGTCPAKPSVSNGDHSASSSER
jgi:hypothetical protein